MLGSRAPVIDYHWADVLHAIHPLLHWTCCNDDEARWAYEPLVHLHHAARTDRPGPRDQG